MLNGVNNKVQDQRFQLDSNRAEMQSTLAQATAAALEYRQVAETLKAKVDNSLQGWEQATNELKRQIEGVLNEVTGLISHRAQLDKSVEELKGFEGKVLNRDRATTNMAEEVWRIGLNFEDAEKWVHGVEAMVESHQASISPSLSIEHPAVWSTSTGDVGEATVPATEVRRIAANLESTSAQVATLTGRMHHWETMPKPELAKVEALELQVRLLMTRMEQSEHEVHALSEQIWTLPRGSPPEGMRPDSHVIGELQRNLESLESKYQLLKHAGTPSVNPVGTPIPKPEPRVRVIVVPAREERVAGSLPEFGFPPAEDDWSSMRSDDRGFGGRAPGGGRSGARTHEGDTLPAMGGGLEALRRVGPPLF